jgi:hypothetical protein
MSVLSNVTASVRETKHIVFCVLAWLNGSSTHRMTRLYAPISIQSSRGVSASMAPLSRFASVETTKITLPINHNQPIKRNGESIPQDA